MNNEVEVTVAPTRFTVSVLPETDRNHLTYTVEVEYRGLSRWAVVHHRMNLSADGEWDFESRPSEREDEWLDAHRFDLDTALALAKRAVLELKINGATVRDHLDASSRS